MALEVQTQKVKLSENLPSFKFSGPVGAYVYGISGFTLSFGGVDHHLQTASIDFLVIQNHDTVNINYTVVFKDDSGHSYSASESSLSVTVVAWVGEGADRNVKLTNVGNSIDNGKASNPIDVGQRPLSTNALLSGYHLSFGNKDRHLQRMDVGVGAQENGKNVELTASVVMYDKSGHNATTANAYAGLLATLVEDPGFEVGVYNQDCQKVSFQKEVDKAVAIFNGFDVGYGDTDHHVKTLKVYSYISLYKDNKVATLICGAHVEDDTGHSNYGDGTVIVIGIYKK